MDRRTIVFALVVVAAYWGYLTWRGVITGPPWSPSPARVGREPS